MPPSANQKHRTNSFDNATRRSWGLLSGKLGPKTENPGWALA